jgi:hypothetical protein
MTFNPYAAGAKTYGMMRSAPNYGPVDKQGYRERDAQHRARRNAVLRRMKKSASGQFAHPDFARWLG